MSQLAEQDLPQLLSSLSSLPPFCPLPRPIHQINKTGLGSSASLVTSLVAALLSYLDLIILPSPSQSEALHHSEQPPPKDGSGLDLVHSLAQYAHCLAQGKVGSGFDISSAVYGTHMYRRFSPSLLTPLLETPETSINHSSGLLATLDPKAWDQDVTPFRLPRGLRLMLADVDAGTDTPSFIGKVLAWHQQETEVALELWTDLGKANDALAELLQELCGHEEDSDYGTILTEASLLPPDELDLSRPVSQLLVRIRASLNVRLQPPPAYAKLMQRSSFDRTCNTCQLSPRFLLSLSLRLGSSTHAPPLRAFWVEGYPGQADLTRSSCW